MTCRGHYQPEPWRRWQDVLVDPRRLPDVIHDMGNTVRDYAVRSIASDAQTLESKLVRLLALCVTGPRFAVREAPSVIARSDGSLECHCRVWFGEQAEYEALTSQAL